MVSVKLGPPQAAHGIHREKLVHLFRWVVKLVAYSTTLVLEVAPRSADRWVGSRSLSDPSHIRFEFAALEDLETECAGSLAEGRAFVPGAVAEVRSRCILVVVHPVTGASLDLPAEVVWVNQDAPGEGVGVTLDDRVDELAAKLAAFLDAEAKPATPAKRPETLQQRVRGYSSAQMIRRAKEADLPERTALERVYGKGVWEMLLHNPRVSPPEVARIARKGSIPQSIVETITGNPAWLTSSEIRRALLSNPRVGGGALDKVLRAMTRNEISLLVKQTAYSMTVRNAARKLLKS
jgi:hypothetical protein